MAVEQPVQIRRTYDNGAVIVTSSGPAGAENPEASMVVAFIESENEEEAIITFGKQDTSQDQVAKVVAALSAANLTVEPLKVDRLLADVRDTLYGD